MNHDENTIAVRRFLYHWNLDSKKWPQTISPNGVTKWIEKDEEYVRQNYGKLNYVEMGRSLGRSPHGVETKAHRLGLTKKIKAGTITK